MHLTPKAKNNIYIDTKPPPLKIHYLTSPSHPPYPDYNPYHAYAPPPYYVSSPPPTASPAPHSSPRYSDRSCRPSSLACGLGRCVGFGRWGVAAVVGQGVCVRKWRRWYGGRVGFLVSWMSGVFFLRVVGVWNVPGCSIFSVAGSTSPCSVGCSPLGSPVPSP
jgi:hypothetical protein